MKDDKYFVNYNMQPGLILKKKEEHNISPKVSIITSYFNSKKYMWQTINCVLNQTFPFWEWIIVDDGSTNQEDIEYLDEVKQIDDRIKVLRKKNEGLAKGRDYAIKYSTTNYILPLDADDLIEPTYIEIMYWMLKTNNNASWAFSNSFGFGKYIYITDELFDSDIMKYRNQITATALIKKEKIIEIDGYGVANRYVNEDWHLWLRMLASNNYPVQASYYGFWYRRRENSLLSEVNDKNKKENEYRIKEINIEANKVKKRIKSVFFPHELNFNDLKYNKLKYNDLKFDKKNEAILYIIPEIGFNKKLQKEIKVNAQRNDVYVISVENSKKSQNANRQNIEKYAIIYNLSSFLEKKYFLGFIDYIINTRNIKKVFIDSNCQAKEIIIKYIDNYELIKYSNSDFLYFMNIIKYKINRFCVIRALKKIIRHIEKKKGWSIK